MELKTITVVVPTYNEQENILFVYQKIANIFEQYRDKYNLKIPFIGNCSKDKSRELIMELAQQDLRVKAIFNAKNFGFIRSTFYGLTQATGKCLILIFADMQDPPEIIHQFSKGGSADIKSTILINLMGLDYMMKRFSMFCKN